MIDRIGNRSEQEGFLRSRLPTLFPHEVEYIRGTADFLALNHYTTSTARYIEDVPIDEIPMWLKDVSANFTRHLDFSELDSNMEMVKTLLWGK